MIGQGTKTPSPAQCTGRGQSFVLLAPLSHLLSALLASSLFYLVQVDLSCLVLHCLALPCLASPLCCCRRCCCRRHADTTYARRGSTALLPTQLPNLCASHPSKAGAQTQHRHLLNCSARRSVPRPASCGITAFWQANSPHVAVGLQFVGARTDCVGAVTSHNTTLHYQPTTSLVPVAAPFLARTQFAFAESHLLFYSSGRRRLRLPCREHLLHRISGESESLGAQGASPQW